MLESTTNIIDIHTSSLIKRLHSYFDELSLHARHWSENLDPMFKLRSLNLITEIYAYVSSFFSNRANRLPEYFNECTLKQCLEWVVEIEELQRNLYDYFQSSDNDNWDIDVQLENILEEDETTVLDSFKLLFTGGAQELCKNCEGMEFPFVGKSLLWTARFKTDTSCSFKLVFRNAKEELDEKVRNFIFSSDPEDKRYNETMSNKLLSKHLAYKTVCQGCNPLTSCSEYNFMDYIKSVYSEAEKATINDINSDLFKALELLRNTFMTDAEDIYYIRTGDFQSLKSIYDEKIINYFYTELPFKQYYIARSSYIKELKDDLIVRLDDWRRNEGCVCRKMTNEEYAKFLEEYREVVESKMKEYQDLWKLRMHSGGLDSEVTSDNFARMFYRRKGVNRYFIELQWELEMVQELINEHTKDLRKLNDDEELSPEQKTVETFVYNIIQLVNKTYDEWNNRRVSLGANKPEAHVIIQREELIKYMQEEKELHFDDLKSICFPETGKTKSNFCKYVVRLQELNSFGKLPNKELAKILAPIVGLTEGTVNNYLSQL